ncbi:MAG TPA: glycosyltransferase family 2 protein [Polyangia bacterium]|nr:glycosyltransferase family 2 protein [Polyangia bacterium]
MKLCLVIPAYQAARHLASVVSRVEASRPTAATEVEAVIVDDGSSDGTAALAHELAATRPWLRVLQRPANGGYGAAMKDGLAHARKSGADCAASVHADGQYGPELLTALLHALDQRHLDLVQGSRIAGGGALAGGMPLYKFAGNWVLNKLERAVFGLPLSDFHSGYLVYGPRALAQVPFQSLGDSFDFDMEVIAAARARGLAVGEEPIPTHYGDEISYLNPLTYGLRVLRVMWRFKRGAYGAEA